MLTHRQELERGITDQLQVFSVELLSAIARGEVDAVQLARQELASRGLSPAGKWVGFERAKQLAGAA